MIFPVSDDALADKASSRRILLRYLVEDPETLGGFSLYLLGEEIGEVLQGVVLHGFDVAVLNHVLKDVLIVQQQLVVGLVEELGNLEHALSWLGLHVFVVQEEDVGVLAVLVPTLNVVEVVPVVSLTGDEDLEKVVELAVGEVVSGETPCVVEHGHASVLRIAAYVEVLGLRMHGHEVVREVRFDHSGTCHVTHTVGTYHLDEGAPVEELQATGWRHAFVEDQEANVLCPRCSAFWICDDELVVWLWLIIEGGAQHFDSEVSAEPYYAVHILVQWAIGEAYVDDSHAGLVRNGQVRISCLLATCGAARLPS